MINLLRLIALGFAFTSSSLYSRFPPFASHIKYKGNGLAFIDVYCSNIMAKICSTRKRFRFKHRRWCGGRKIFVDSTKRENRRHKRAIIILKFDSVMWTWSIWNATAMNCNFNGFFSISTLIKIFPSILFLVFIIFNVWFHDDIFYKSTATANRIFFFRNADKKFMNISNDFIVQWFRNLLAYLRKNIFLPKLGDVTMLYDQKTSLPHPPSLSNAPRERFRQSFHIALWFQELFMWA